jgi:CBS domain-containing protein
MANCIAEVMNHDVLSFAAITPARSALDLMLALHVTTAPVIDGRDHPIGVVSLRELSRATNQSRVRDFVRVPALRASPETSLLDAARLLDEADLHHLVVTNASGELVGFVSSLDLLRGIIGAPARHPETFVHWDSSVGMAFSNDRVLDPEHVGDTPHTAGLVVLVRGGAGRPERVVWVESTLDIKEWLRAYFDDPDALARRMGPSPAGTLRYRYAEISDPSQRDELAFRMREEAQRVVNHGAR